MKGGGIALALTVGMAVGGYIAHSLDAHLVKKTLGGQSLSIRNNVWSAAVDRATCQTQLYNLTAVR